MQQDYRGSQSIPNKQLEDSTLMKEAKLYLMTDLMLEALQLEVDSFVIGASFETKKRKEDTLVFLNGRIITGDKDA